MVRKEIGDFIVVGEHSGVVEHLGVKTVRIASVNGEQIIVSNKDLTDSRVRNYKRMDRSTLPLGARRWTITTRARSSWPPRQPIRNRRCRTRWRRTPRRRFPN